MIHFQRFLASFGILVLLLSILQVSSEDIGDKDYVVIHSPMNWYQASDYCTRMNMRLLTIESEKANEHAKAFLDELGKGRWSLYWTAANCLGEHRKFVWDTTGEPASYTNWRPNEPNNALDGEPCVNMDKDNKWNDVSCQYNFPFVCESNKVIRCSQGK